MAASAPSTDAAAALLGRWVERGVTEIVVSPGSRSQAPALVAAALAATGAVRLHVRIDERVAGFTALGIGRETRLPAVVVCTSGTAVANLHPAVLEAHHAGVPLIVLTADRPPELRGVGANQTTVQPGIFGSATRLALDLPVPDAADDDDFPPSVLRAAADAAFDAALGLDGPPGPVQVNAPYREPLAGTVPEAVRAIVVEPAAVRMLRETVDLPRGPRTIVVAGADAGPDAEQVAHAGGWPLVAEIVSGARFGRNLVHGYRRLLSESDLGGRVQRVVVFGHPTLSREVAGLLSDVEVEVVAVRSGGVALDLNHRTRAVDAVSVAAGDPDREWLGAWLRASRDAAVDLTPPAPDADGLASAVPRERLDAIAAEMGVIRQTVDRATLADAVWRATWPHDRLVFGSSRIVRVADDVLGGKKVPVHANRGLAGIDGTVATAIGIALASQRGGAPGVTRLLLGDLAVLHDVGALLLPADEPRPRLQVIVGNDGGGTIFDTLEVAGTAEPSAFDRLFYTPQSVDFSALAAAYGWSHERVDTRVALDQALTAPLAGCRIIEVPLAR